MTATVRVLYSGGRGAQTAARWAIDKGEVQLISFVPSFADCIDQFKADIGKAYGSYDPTWTPVSDGSGGWVCQLTHQVSSVIYPLAFPGLLEEDAVDLVTVMDSAGATAHLKALVARGLLNVAEGDTIVLGVTIDHFLRDADMDNRMIALSSFLREKAGGEVTLALPNRSLRKPAIEGSAIFWTACAPPEVAKLTVV